MSVHGMKKSSPSQNLIYEESNNKRKQSVGTPHLGKKSLMSNVESSTNAEEYTMKGQNTSEKMNLTHNQMAYKNLIEDQNTKVNVSSFDQRPQIPHQMSQQQTETPSQLSQISFPLDVSQLNHQPIQKTAVTSYESPQQNQALPSFQYFKSYSNSKFFLLLWKKI